MQPDEARAADAKAWLAKAADDMHSASHALAAEPALREDAAFHCQQAVEKLFKAFLTWHDVPFRKTHSLEELGYQCLSVDPSLRPLVGQAAPLSEYAVRFRYPGPSEPLTPAEVDEAMTTARAAADQILTRLPGAVHPEARGG